MIMMIMMRRMGLMMTDSQRRDKSRLTEDLVSSRPSRVDDDEYDDDAENPLPLQQSLEILVSSERVHMSTAVLSKFPRELRTA